LTHALGLTETARADIVAILRWSLETFGFRARARYAALIATTLEDLRKDPNGFGSLERTELQAGLRTYRLRLCRGRAGLLHGVVTAPRHFLAYRLEGPDHVLVLRVLHDAMELAARLGDAPDAD